MMRNMSHLHSITPIVLLALLAFLCLSAGPARAQTLHELPSPQRPAWMEKDVPLQTFVNVDIKGKPLGVVCEIIAAKTGVDIRASRDIAEYRVSLHVTHETLSAVMGRVVDLFGHGKLPNTGYEWVRVTENEAGKEKPVRYLLRRNARALEEESALLDYPLATAKRWLRQLRDYAQCPPEQRANFQTQCPNIQLLQKNNKGLLEGSIQPIGEALASLSDSQLEALAQNKQLQLPMFVLSDASVSMLRKSSKDGTDASDNSNRPAGAFLYLQHDQDISKDIYVIGMAFATGTPRYNPYSLALDTLHELPLASDTDADAKARLSENTPEIDLFAHEHIPPGKQPMVSLTAALRLLARESGLSLYAEVFLKPRQALPHSTGKPKFLLSTRRLKSFGSLFSPTN